jgi:hypothetical protein
LMRMIRGPDYRSIIERPSTKYKAIIDNSNR